MRDDNPKQKNGHLLLRNHHILFSLLLVAFIIGGIAQMRVLPPMEGSDEPLHVTYVAYLREHGQLPPRADYLTNCTRQQSGQPPLLYALGALVLDMAQAPRFGCDAVYTYYYDTASNPWRLSPDPQRTDDNKTNFLPLQNPPPPDGLPQSLYILRGVSLLFGVLAVWGMYHLAGDVFGQGMWQLSAVAVFAFTPTFFHLSAYFTNDTPATAFSVWALWLIVRTLKQGATWRHTAALGLVLGLGGLAKVSVLLLAPAAVIAITIATWQRTDNRFSRWIAHGIIMAITVGLTFGLWMGWGWLTMRDPFGTNTHVHPTLNYHPPLGWDAVWRGLPDIYATYVGLLGYANVYLPQWMIGLLASVAGIMLLRLVIAARSASREQLIMIGVLALVSISVFLGFTRWYRTIFGVTGRLLMPSHGVYALALTGGAMLWAGQSTWRRALSIAVLVGASLWATAWTFPTLQTAYRPTLITADALPPLQGNRIIFDDTVRLLGYHTESDTLTTPIHTLTLCWEVLQPTERHAAYAVRYVKDGIPTASRTTIFGLGRYNSTLWQTGDIFCDVVDMPVGNEGFGAVPPEVGQRYDILVVLLDAATQDVNWQATSEDGTPIPFPVLGQIIYPE